MLESLVRLYEHACRRLCTSQRGFSMNDTLITLAMIGLATTATLPAAVRTLHTYQRNGAAREVLAELRQTQQMAVTRRGVHGLQWGADPNVQYSPSQFRLVRDTTGSCGIPAKDAAEDGTNVVQDWEDLSREYSGVRIESIRDNTGTLMGGVMFDSRGASVNTCGPVSFPVEITVADSKGRTRVIEIQRAGSTRLL